MHAYSTVNLECGLYTRSNRIFGNKAGIVLMDQPKIKKTYILKIGNLSIENINF